MTMIFWNASTADRDYASEGLSVGYVVQEYTALRTFIFILSTTVLTAGY